MQFVEEIVVDEFLPTFRSLLAGELLIRAAAEAGATIVPIDSEHNAIFQCLPADGDCADVRRLVLTASGGPFRGRTRAELAEVTLEQALEFIDDDELVDDEEDIADDAGEIDDDLLEEDDDDGDVSLDDIADVAGDEEE